ncbi:MAG: hypothetical protein ACK55Z_15470, partial [bacterium]
SKAVIEFIKISRAKNISIEYKNIEYPKSSSLNLGNARSNGVTAAYVNIKKTCNASQIYLTVSSG